MPIFSWNYRGLGHPSKAGAIKDLIKIPSPNVLLLQETKFAKETLLSISELKWKKKGGIIVSVKGSSSGIATMWVEDSFSLQNSFKTQHWIFTKIWHLASKTSLSIFNMYIHVIFQERKDCWKTLLEYVDANLPPNMIVVGDLNIMLDPKDKNRGVCGRGPMLKIVENFIQLWYLIDFKPKKGRFMWTNNIVGAATISARLDRFLVQSSFLEKKLFLPVFFWN